MKCKCQQPSVPRSGYEMHSTLLDQLRDFRLLCSVEVSVERGSDSPSFSLGELLPVGFRGGTQKMLYWIKNEGCFTVFMVD